MTISSTANRTVTATNGATTAFPFDYYFLQDEDLVVLKTTLADNSVATLVLNSDYTVAGAGDPNGGTVTITPALATGYRITIYRDPEATQELDLVPNDELPAEPLEQSLDKITMILQRLRDMIGRALRFADGDVSGADTTVPSPEVGKFLRWNAAGTGIENATVTSGASVVQASTAAQGIVELATDVEAAAGTDGQRAMTPHATRMSIAGRNLLINGDFSVNQNQVNGAVVDAAYTLDGWYALTQTASITVSQGNDIRPDVPYNWRGVQSQATAQRFGVAQIIEAADSKPTRGDALTLSGKVALSSAGNVRVAVLGWTGTTDSVNSDVVSDWTNGSFTVGNFFKSTNFAVIGVSSRLALAAATLTDFSVPLLNGTFINNLVVFVWTEDPVAQNVALSVADMQLERDGQSAFEQRPFAATLERCQRFFWSTFPYRTAPANNTGDASGALAYHTPVAGAVRQSVNTRHPVPMHHAPTVTFYNPLAANAKWRNNTQAADSGTASSGVVGDAGASAINPGVSGDAAGDLLTVHATFDARL